MCETEGFIPPTAVGKDVKCANAKCLVPVFKAPAPKVETAPEPTPKKKSNLLLVGGVTIAVMAVVGVAAVFLPGMLATAPVPKSMSEEDKALLTQSSPVQPAPPVKTTETPSVNPAPDVTTPVAATIGSEELVTKALKELNDACLTNQPRQRSKPACRQLAAEACIYAGDLKGASDHLAQLTFVGPNVPYYKIEPNLCLFWLNWEQDKAAATRFLDTALDDAQKLPKIGRHQMGVASRLAAALAAAGRIPEAQKLLESHQSEENEGQISARIQMASDGRLLRITRNLAILPWTRPQAAATTSSLIAYNQFAAGRSWSESQPNDEAKAECFAIWAEGVAFKQAKPGPANANPEIEEAIKGLSPALKSRVWTRAALGRFLADDLNGAAATLKLATAELAKVAVPPEPEMPAIKATVNYKSPDDAPLVHAATAAAEIAFAQTLWPDQRSQAEATLDQALTFARGLAPGWAAVSERSNQAEQAGPAGLRELLKREMSLKSDDQANQNSIRYRRVLTDLVSASQRRFNLQATIMSRLADAGLKDKIWSVVSERSAETNISRRDDFLTSALIGELAEKFRGTETEKVIQAAVGTPIDRPDAAVVKDLVKQNPAEAGQYVSRLEGENGPRDDIALTTATSLAASGDAERTFAFIGKLDDIVLKEDAYRLASALLAQHGKHDDVWKQVDAVQQATEKASICRGLVVGIKGGKPLKEIPSGE